MLIGNKLLFHLLVVRERTHIIDDRFDSSRALTTYRHLVHPTCGLLPVFQGRVCAEGCILCTRSLSKGTYVRGSAKGERGKEMESDQHRLRQDVLGHVGLRVIGGYAVCKGDRGHRHT